MRRRVPRPSEASCLRSPQPPGPTPLADAGPAEALEGGPALVPRQRPGMELTMSRGITAVALLTVLLLSLPYGSAAPQVAGHPGILLSPRRLHGGHC